MRTIGGLLLVVGVVLAVLDLVRARFLPYQLALGIVLAVVGVVLVVLAQRSDRGAVTESAAAEAVRTTATERETAPAPDRAMSTPVGYGPPSEAGAAPGTATTSAPGEATAATEPPVGPAVDRDPQP